MPAKAVDDVLMVQLKVPGDFEARLIKQDQRLRMHNQLEVCRLVVTCFSLNWNLTPDTPDTPVTG